MMVIKNKGSFAATIIGMVAVSCGAALGYIGAARYASMDTSSGYRPSARLEPGPELALIYIGSASCGASNREALPGHVEKAKLAVQEAARRSGMRFVAVGVARDLRVEAGLQHLHKFGRFDEVMTGRGWMNIGALKYIYEDHPGLAATPQLLVLERVVHFGKEGTSIANERVLARKVGTSEIETWVKRGVAFPSASATLRSEPGFKESAGKTDAVR